MRQGPSLVHRLKLFFVAWSAFVAMMTVFHGLQLVSLVQTQHFKTNFIMCTSADAISVQRHVESILGDSAMQHVSVAAGERIGICPDRQVFEVEFDALLQRSEATAVFGALTDPAQDMYQRSLGYTVAFPADRTAGHAMTALPAMVLALILWICLEKRVQSQGANSHGHGKLAQLAVLCSLVALAMPSALGLIFGAVGLREEHAVPSPDITWSVILIAVLAAPITEEVMFRYWLLQHMARAIGPMAALLLSSAVFSLVHFEFEPFIVLSRFIAGLCLGALWLRTSSLWACVLAHGLLNAGVLGLSALASTAGN